MPSPPNNSYRREITQGRTSSLSKTLPVKFMPSPRIRASSVVAMLAASLVWSPPVAGQQQTFRAGVNTVPIYATVTDARGALVTSLGPDDFLVEDDGRSREITLFQSGVQPMSIAILVDGSPSLFDVDVAAARRGHEVRGPSAAGGPRLPRHLQPGGVAQSESLERSRRPDPTSRRRHADSRGHRALGRDRGGPVGRSSRRADAASCSCSPTRRTTAASQMSRSCGRASSAKACSCTASGCAAARACRPQK